MDNVVNFVRKTLKLNNDVAKKTSIMLLICLAIFLFVGLFYIILFSATNYSKLGKLNDYIEEFKKKNRTEFMEAFNVGLKVMPSYNSEGNVILMEHIKSVNLFFSFSYLV